MILHNPRVTDVIWECASFIERYDLGECEFQNGTIYISTDVAVGTIPITRQILWLHNDLDYTERFVIPVEGGPLAGGFSRAYTTLIKALRYFEPSLMNCSNFCLASDSGVQ